MYIIILVSLTKMFWSMTKASYGLRNRPLEWNDYSYGIVIPLFGKGLFHGIVIPI